MHSFAALPHYLWDRMLDLSRALLGHPVPLVALTFAIATPLVVRRLRRR
jgi:hypothetical protein